jgi:hypothetical protein
MGFLSLWLSLFVLVLVIAEVTMWISISESVSRLVDHLKTALETFGFFCQREFRIGCFGFLRQHRFGID